MAFNEDLRARQRELATAEQLLADNNRQVSLGVIAELEVTRAQAGVYTSQQDLLISQTNLLQQETVLKNALSRNGVLNSNLADLRVIPLDRIAVPPAEPARPLPALVEAALSQRAEVEQARVNIDSNELNLVGIKNSLKPTLQAFAELTNKWFGGPAHRAGGSVGNCRESGGRIWNSAGGRIPAKLSELLSRIVAEYSF